jgi:hypothetical protein
MRELSDADHCDGSYRISQRPSRKRDKGLESCNVWPTNEDLKLKREEETMWESLPSIYTAWGLYGASQGPVTLPSGQAGQVTGT